MSGQPYRYASDPAIFRAEYMNTLSLQADINALNLDANKTYISTGQLPAISQMTDTRTTSEILADTEKLKVELIKDLKSLGNASFAQGIVQAIERSPLNADGSLMTFFAQRAPEIVKNIERQYKYGIRGDTNDIQRFVGFVEDMYNKTKSLTSSVKTYFSKPQESELGGGIITIGELEKVKGLYDEIARRLMLKFGSPNNVLSQIEQDVQTEIYFISLHLRLAQDFLQDSEYVENTKTFLDSQIVYMGNEDFTDVVDRFYNLYLRYNEILEEFPKGETLLSLIRQLDNSTRNSNPELSLKILREIDSLISFADELEDLGRSLKEARKEFEKLADLTDKQFVEQPKFPGEGQKLGPINAPLPNTGGDAERMNYEGKVITNREYQSLSTMRKQIEQLTDEADSPNGVNVQQINQLVDMINKTYTILGHPELQVSKDDEIETITEQGKSLIQLLDDEIIGHGIKMGKGILINPKIKKQKKGRGRPKGCGISKPKTYKESVKAHSVLDKGIMETPRFLKFGKYLINTHKLNNEDIFALKRPAGGNIVDIPSVKISKNLSGVIKKMLGGEIPTYSDISKLSEPEKAYLHKVSQKSNILDKFDIPAPSKDQKEKDIHQFEVMKGEILAGNDNKELIKKFKAHILKLSKNGTLPKREVQEILEDLLELGN